ncbi:SusC/RagA family TonB-linked outer membrane protein [Mucilaginibacter sp. KACC 22063]|uniref:SusC/RagA family TonB-linked outer membrane protein n=1 Tax=Mucilaginibacter sp. KACC 22063 TaxID=3025666 RepID=UPI002365FD4B|nr:SusC/RagA family TonB-linked outer membrane protein [Mucilaginibacter sp. KACC 22063]WDF55268.1 SusC/RagA family TonB-linked outer membrane protein [Mucilaginibacter sp. KACC 22063]
MKKILLNFLWVLILLGTQAYAQIRTVTGTVTGKDDGLPLPGVSVVVKGTKTGVQTSADGTYSIKVERGQALTFSFIGFVPQTVVPANNRLDVVLSGRSSDLNEVVVIGYGTQVKRDNNGSISSVKGADLAQQPVQNFQQSLGGRAASVQVTVPGATLNSNPVIRIRGINSVALSSQPLYVIDGVPAFDGTQNGGTAAGGSPLGNINPEDIESVDIAKDASAGAIYGSRAANGVIFITTKKGKKGKAVVTLDSWIGQNKAYNLPKMLNAQQYTDIKNEALVNAGLYNANTTYFAVQTGPDGQPVNTNWFDYIYKTGTSYNNTVSVSGATEQTNYYLSANWTKQNGILVKNSFEKKGILANVDHKAGKYITIGGKIAYTNQLNNAATGSGSQDDAFSITGLGRIGLVSPPNVSGYNNDGSYNLNSNTLGIGANKGVSFSYYNILPIIDMNRSNNELNQVNSNIYFQVKPLSWLTLKTTYGIDYLFRNIDIFQNALQGDGVSSSGSATDTYSNQKRWVWDNTLQIDKAFGKHTFNAVFGNEQDRRTIRGFGINRTGISDQGFNVIQAGYSANAASGNQYSDYYLVSFFGRLNYDFDKKYYISGTVRRDDYSVFGPSNKKGYFPGASVGYEITREKFWTQIGADKIFSSFKLRGSYGKVGNAQGFGAYDSYGLYSNGLYNGGATLQFNQTGNANLKWETIFKTDIGFNFGILNDKITGEVAYYKNKIKDLIFSVPTIPSAGLPTNPSVNIGSMYNKGLEITLNARGINTKDFTWSPSFNISFNQNKLTSIVPGINKLTNSTSGNEVTNINEVGHSLGSLYIVRTAGVDPATGRRIFLNAAGQKVYYYPSGAIPTGHFQWEYADGTRASAITQAADAVNYANTAPKVLGGFSNYFRYKGFDLNVLFTYQLGYSIYYGTRAGLHDQRFWNNSTDILTGRWTTPGQTGADFAKVVYGDNVSNGSSLPLDINVFSGNFVKLKSINLGYALPKDLISRIGLSNLRVYLSAYNLFTITKYPGPDPEISSNSGNGTAAVGVSNSTQGVDRNQPGLQRTFTAGFNVKF